jgi:hypothetical protein
MGTPISFNSGTTTTYTTGVFKRGTIGLNLANSLASNTNWWNGVDVTATQYLIYSDIYSQGQSTFAGSRPTAWTTPDLTDASLIALINTLPDRVGLPIFTTVSQATNWLNQTGKYFLIKTGYENIVTSNLTLNLDPAWYTSYPGTGTAWNDISGNNSNFTLINGVGFSTIGQGSLSFDGTDDVSTGYVSNINSTAGQYNTVTFWMYWAGNSGGFPFELGGYRLWTPGTNFGFNTGNGDIYGIDGTPLINTWVHVTAVFYNGAYTGNNKLYINGVLQTLTQRVGSASSGTATAGVAIGGFQGAYTSYPFQGKIGPFQIYNGELTQAQILQNFNAQAYRFGVNNDVVTSGLLLYLDANDKLSYPGTGTVWYDLSGNNANATLINSPTWNSNGYFTFDAIDDVIDGINVPQDYIDLHIQMYSDGGNGTGLEMVVSKYNDYDKSFRTSNGIFRHNNNGGDANDWNYLNTQYDYVDGNFLTTDYNLTGDWHFVRLARTNPTFDPPFVYSLSSNFYDRGYFGKIRKVLMYNRTLSPSEVVQNYYQGNVVTSGLVSFLDSSNIVSYHTTGSTWYNLVGSSANSTLTNGPTYSNTYGGVLQFDGSDDYAIAASPGSYSEYTFMFFCQWITATANASRIFGLDSFGTYTIFNPYDVGFHYNPLGGSPPSTTISSGVNVGTGNWCHVAVTVSATNSLVTIYVNGVARNSTSLIPGGDFSGNYFIGAQNTLGLVSNCYIGNFMLYNRQLNALEVSQNFQVQKSRFGL